jgi:cystathionine beta-lyase/cystathionine gamma-synthase
MASPTSKGSIEDFLEDLAGLDHLAGSLEKRVELAMNELEATRCFVSVTAHRDTSDGFRSLLRKIGERRSEVERLAEAVLDGDIGSEDFVDLKREVSTSLRNLHTQAAALIVSNDWASPSIEHSRWSHAGRRTHTIRAGRDDYTRDRHSEAERFERAWLSQYVDDPLGLHPGALMTSGGMAAFVTILHHVTATTGNGLVLAGRQGYHECLDLLRASPLGHRLIEIDEEDSEAWRTAIGAGTPEAIFLDSICNRASLAMPDLRNVIRSLARQGRPCYLVVDNTCGSLAIQPWRQLPDGWHHPLIVFESVTKYAQFGFDHAPAGIIVCSPTERNGLDAMREHLGTNVADITVNQIPSPDRVALAHRLRRLSRNVALLAQAVASRELPIDIVHRPPSYPPGHASGFLSLRFHDGSPHARRFVDAALCLARRRRVPLVEGTSFGFDVTRLYLVPGHSEPDYVRVSAGTEHVGGVAQVGKVLADALASSCAWGNEATARVPHDAHAP